MIIKNVMKDGRNGVFASWKRREGKKVEGARGKVCWLAYRKAAWSGATDCLGRTVKDKSAREGAGC